MILPENSPSVELGNVIVTVREPLGSTVNIVSSNVRPDTSPSPSIFVISKSAVPVFSIVIVRSPVWPASIVPKSTDVCCTAMAGAAGAGGGICANSSPTLSFTLLTELELRPLMVGNAVPSGPTTTKFSYEAGAEPPACRSMGKVMPPFLRKPSTCDGLPFQASRPSIATLELSL